MAILQNQSTQQQLLLDEAPSKQTPPHRGFQYALAITVKGEDQLRDFPELDIRRLRQFDCQCQVAGIGV